MQGPFNGKFLRVDLTNGTTTVEEVPDLTSRMYLGGAAMAAYLLNRELKPGVDLSFAKTSSALAEQW